MRIIYVSRSEFDQHIATSAHSYSYYRIGDAVLEVIATAQGAFKASFMNCLPEGRTYANNDELAHLNLLCTGTPFQIKVWQAAQTIPSGVTVSYHQVAQRIGHPQAYRAVGTALGNNKLAYLIPCHRVIAKNGTISGGYRWGKDIKEQLLRLESRG